jgi:PhnB protein
MLRRFIESDSSERGELMSEQTMPAPAGYNTVTAYFAVRGATRAIEWYTQVFGATELTRFEDSDGRLGHAEIRIGDTRLMISDEYPEINVVGPQSLGNTSVSFYLYVDDVDAVCERAVAAGAISLHPVADQGYGDRRGIVRDPFGHRWMVATSISELAPAGEAQTA